MEAYSSGEEEGQYSDDEYEIIEIDDDNYIPDHEILYNSSFYPSIKDFDGPPSCMSGDTALNGHEPINYFDLYFDENLLEHIVQQTNLYQQQNPEPELLHMKSWEDVRKDELKKFFGLTMLMGHIKKVKLDDYWSCDELLITPTFPQNMTRNRYEQILRFLHFANNEVALNHSLAKLKFVIDNLNLKFSKILQPGRNLCIYKSLLLWKGRLRFKQFLPLKRNRFGIKLFQLVDCTSGYILGFIVYTGADTEYKKFDLGVTGDVVAHFLEPYFRKGHVVYVHNWYSSPLLAEFLHEKETGICGTVKKIRKGLPIFKDKLDKGESQVVHNQIWLALKWQDKKEVWMITTVHELSYASTGKRNYQTGEDKIKPTCIIDYNKNMGGVDNVDRQLALTQSIRKSLKWYRKLFFHLMDLSLINAHALYKLRERKISFTDFRMSIIRALLDDITIERSEMRTRLSRLSVQHLPEKGTVRRRCTLCSLRKKRARTRYECSGCNVPLCIDNCFKEYHTVKNLVP